MTITDACRSCRDHEVAAQQQLQPTPDGHAIDTADQGFAECTNCVKTALHGVHIPAGLARCGLHVRPQLGNVPAGAEGAALTRQDHHAGVRIGVCTLHGLRQLFQHPEIQRIERLGTVQDDPRRRTAVHVMHCHEVTGWCRA